MFRLPPRSGEKGPASSDTESMIRPWLWADTEIPPPRWATTRFMSSYRRPMAWAYLWPVARALRTWQKLVRVTSLKPVTRASGSSSSLVTAS